MRFGYGAGDSAIVRYGIGIYGINPSNGDLALKDESSLNASASLGNEMVKGKKLEAGDTVSYGATYTAEEEQW